MDRRTFMRALLAVPLAPLIPYRPKQAIDKLYGIDWGLNDATVGTWMGITRSTTPQFVSSWVHPPGGAVISKDMITLIRKMMDKAMEDNQRQLDIATYAQPLVVYKKRLQDITIL
jgi:hypothetical protein